MPLWTFHQSTVNTPLASSAGYASAANSAPGWVFWPDADVDLGERDADPAAFAPAYRAICCAGQVRWRRRPGPVLASASARGGAARVPVQDRRSRSCGPAMDSTTWFQVPASPPPTMPSGQLPGVVSTAPILMRRVDRLHRVGVRDDLVGVRGRALVGVVVGLPARRRSGRCRSSRCRSPSTSTPYPLVTLA